MTDKTENPASDAANPATTQPTGPVETEETTMTEFYMMNYGMKAVTAEDSQTNYYKLKVAEMYSKKRSRNVAHTLCRCQPSLTPSGLRAHQRRHIAGSSADG